MGTAQANGDGQQPRWDQRDVAELYAENLADFGRGTRGIALRECAAGAFGWGLAALCRCGSSSVRGEV